MSIYILASHLYKRIIKSVGNPNRRKQKMKYYARTFVTKDYQGRFGKAVYVPCTEYFKTNSEKFLASANKFKKVKFSEANEETRKALRHMDADKIYSDTEQLSASEIHFRRSISRR